MSNPQDDPRELRERVRGILDRLTETESAGRFHVPSYNLLATALDELEKHSEALRVTEEALRVQNDVLKACALSRDAGRRSYEWLFSSASDAVLVTDMAGLVSEANPTAARMLGRRAYRFPGISILAFVSTEAREVFKQELLIGAAVQGRRVVFQRTGGDAFVVMVSMMPIQDAAGALRLHWLIRPCG